METHKKTYKTPQIDLIALDSEISLALESNPPAGPDEAHNAESFTVDYFKCKQA